MSGTEHGEAIREWDSPEAAALGKILHGLFRYVKEDACPVYAATIIKDIRAGKVPGVRVVPTVGPDPRDQWYPGADGVNTVEELWAFYCARGDQIAELSALRQALATMEKERDESRAAQRSIIVEFQQAMCDVFLRLGPPTNQHTPWREQVIAGIDAIESERDSTLESLRGMREALAELAYLKGEKDWLDDHAVGVKSEAESDEWHRRRDNYITRKPLAWKAARAITATSGGA